MIICKLLLFYTHKMCPILKWLIYMLITMFRRNQFWVYLKVLKGMALWVFTDEKVTELWMIIKASLFSFKKKHNVYSFFRKKLKIQWSRESYANPCYSRRILPRKSNVHSVPSNEIIAVPQPWCQRKLQRNGMEINSQLINISTWSQSQCFEVFQNASP